MAKFSERRRYVSHVIQPSTRSTLGEYDSRPPLARYVWYFTSYLRSSCCSETQVRPRLLPVFLPLSTLDDTHVRRCTRPSPLYRTASDEKLGVGLGTRLAEELWPTCGTVRSRIGGNETVSTTFMTSNQLVNMVNTKSFLDTVNMLRNIV